MKKLLFIITLAVIALGCLAQTPGSPNWVTFTRTSPTTGTIRWSAEPSANVSYYYLAIHPTTTQYLPPAYCDPNWNAGSDWAASQTLEAPGIYMKDVIGLDPGQDYYAYVAAVETASWSWGAYSSWETPALPVELASFTAVLTSDYYVNLTWVTISESEILGFNVLRNETNDASTAIQINDDIIRGTNSSTTHSYTMIDNEVESGVSYYYWLQNVDMNGESQLHGPQSVTMNAPPVNSLPQVSTMSNSYPNPFRAISGTTIDLSVKENETGILSVFNIRGQLITKRTFTAGEHQFAFDAQNCPSGMYYYKLSTPTTNIVKKMIILK